MTNQDYSQQVNAAFTSLRKGLRPFVEQEMMAVHKNHWLDECQRAGVRPDREGNYTWDIAALLKIITNAICWRDVFAMEKRRGAKERGVFVTLLEWRHELKGHDDADVSRQTAQDVIESVIHALRCVDAKDQLEVVEELLRSLVPQPLSPPVVPEPQILQVPPTPSSYQTDNPNATSLDVVAAPAETEQLKISRTTNFWDSNYFDFADALNEEIWLLSPEVQQQVQSLDVLKRPGVIGAQQAMLDSSLSAMRGPLPWVPDLVGKESQEETGIIIVGSAYAGFIHEYSTRHAKMPLSAYLTASSVQDFQRFFLRDVVLDDPSYYMPIQHLCSDLGNASRLSLVDLCRASLVKRDVGDSKRSDSTRNIFKEDPATFEKYVENEQAAEWLWRRFVGGKAKCVIALGSTAEHGLLRLFTNREMTITQDEALFHPKHLVQGGWVIRYADPKKNLKFWLDHKTWWTVRGQVNGMERVWHVLPIYHPAIHQKPSHDPDYKQTKAIMKLMQASLGF